MNIGGRIIQTGNISINTETEFEATYKKHIINVKLHKEHKGANPEWDIDRIQKLPLSDKDKECILGKNAIKIYDL